MVGPERRGAGGECLAVFRSDSHIPQGVRLRTVADSPSAPKLGDGHRNRFVQALRVYIDAMENAVGVGEGVSARELAMPRVSPQYPPFVRPTLGHPVVHR